MMPVDNRSNTPTIDRNSTTAPASVQDLDTLLTVADVAAWLKVSTSWVYEHTRARGAPRSERLPHLKVGKYVRFEPRAVRAFLERKCRAT